MLGTKRRPRNLRRDLFEAMKLVAETGQGPKIKSHQWAVRSNGNPDAFIPLPSLPNHLGWKVPEFW